MTTAAWRIVLLASLGGTLEFYDFVITAPAFVMVACGLFTLVGSFGLSRDGGYVLEGAGRGAVGARHAG